MKSKLLNSTGIRPVMMPKRPEDALVRSQLTTAQKNVARAQATTKKGHAAEAVEKMVAAGDHPTRQMMRAAMRDHENKVDKEHRYTVARAKKMRSRARSVARAT